MLCILSMFSHRFYQTSQYCIVGSSYISFQLETTAIDAACIVPLKTMLTMKEFLKQSYRCHLQTAHLVGCVAQLVERRSLTGELSLSCARPAADG